MNFANIFLRTPFFYRTPQVAASVKVCNLTKIRFRHGCFFVNFLKILGTFFFFFVDALQEFFKNSKNYWRKKRLLNISADGCFVMLSTVMITTMRSVS